MNGYPRLALHTSNNGMVSMDAAWDRQRNHQGVYEKELAVKTHPPAKYSSLDLLSAAPADSGGARDTG